MKTFTEAFVSFKSKIRGDGSGNAIIPGALARFKNEGLRAFVNDAASTYRQTEAFGGDTMLRLTILAAFEAGLSVGQEMFGDEKEIN